MKRKVITQKYAEAIEAMYEEAAKLWTAVLANGIVFCACLMRNIHPYYMTIKHKMISNDNDD